MIATHLNQVGVTLYKNVSDNTGRHSTVGECLAFIRGDETLALWRLHLHPLYAQFQTSGLPSDKAKYDDAKKDLPAMTISGTFTKRGIAGLEKYSGLIQVDLDKLTSRGIDITELRQRVELDPHVAFAFTSPSGDGLKIAVLVASGVEDHTKAFLGVQRYFLATYGIWPDDACKDVSRLCFLSSDPSVFTNERPIPLDWAAWPETNLLDDDDDEATAIAFPLDAFPAIIPQVAIAYSEVHQVDAALPAVSALSVISAAFGSAVKCTGAKNGTVTPCNLFTLIIAPSGYGKGGVGRIAKPLLDYSAELSARFELNELPTLKADIAIAGERRKGILNNLKSDKLTAGDAAKARLELIQLETHIARWTYLVAQSPSLYTGSATGAALGVALERNNEQLFSFALEAGDAMRIAAGMFTPGNRGDFDLFLSGYTGEPYNESRITRDRVNLASPCLSVLWACQPSLARELFGNVEARERGLLGRFNVVQCDYGVIPRDDGVVREVPPALQAEWNRIVRAAIEFRVSGRKVTFHVEPRAFKVFLEFHNEVVEILNGEGRDNEAKMMRGRENAIRIANVIAATEWLSAGAQGDSPILTTEHAARGVVLAEYFLDQTLKLTRGAVIESQHQRLSELLQLIQRSNASITLRLLRDNHGFSDDEVRRIVTRNADKLRIETRAPGPKGGRPSELLVAI